MKSDCSIYCTEGTGVNREHEIRTWGLNEAQSGAAVYQVLLNGNGKGGMGGGGGRERDDLVQLAKSDIKRI